MAEQNNKRKKKEPRQSWKPHWLPDTLYKIWLAVFAAFKIAMGAVATVLLIVVVCGFVFVGILGDYLQVDILPDSEMVKENYDMDETSFIHYVDSNGNIQELQEIYATTTDRDWATYDEIPQALVNAAVAIEDKRFYEHQGVDWITTVKACAGMFFGSGDAGGSTITQQLVKNMTGDNSVTVRRKVVEIFKAQDFERRYDKNTIMEWYLNMIYFGDRKNGVKSAAAHYFGKELCNLTPAECASLISITNNPSIFSPYTGTFEYKGEMLSGEERNNIRKENTLWMMRNEGYLTEDEYQAALAQKIEFKSGIAAEDRMAYCENKECGYKGVVSTLVVKDDLYHCPQCDTQIHVTDHASTEVYSWFVDTVLEDVAGELAARDGMIWAELGKVQREFYLQLIQRGGYHIYTTLDMEVQQQVDKIYTDLSQIPETRGGQQLQSGIVVIDNRTGDIVAMAGGVGEKVVFDAFNMATDAKRQIGSSIKPLSVYAPAFEVGGFSPATIIKDLPLRYNVDATKQEGDEGYLTAFPRNSTRDYSYATTIKYGIAESVNAVAVNTLDLIGTRYSYNYAKNMFKLNGLIESGRNGTTDIDYSPLALGGLTDGATVRDMASAYATFANNGTYREGRTFTKVYDSEGNLIIDNTQDAEQIVSQKTVDYMNYCLDQAVDNGTGTLADLKDIGIDVCGKTGTTNSRMDRYFCGYTGYYTAAVWCGFEIPAEIVLVGQSGHPGARLWKKVMEPLHKGKENIPLYNEENMVEITVCLDSGKLVTDACSSDIRGISRTETVLVYEEDVPMGYCDQHISMEYCSEGDAVANEYCRKFAEVGMLKLEQRSLVKITQSLIDELAMAEEFGLKSAYLKDNYIYQVDDSGNPVPFHGIHGDLNIDGTDSCVTCPVHTQESWEQYKAEHPWIDNPNIQEPDNNDTGDTGEDNWWENLWPITTEGEEE